MRRGDVYLADLDNARGSAAAKLRPVVLVSHDALNRTVASLGRGVVTVVPLTSKVAVVHPFQVFGAGRGGRSGPGQQGAGRACQLLLRHPGVGHGTVPAIFEHALRPERGSLQGATFGYPCA